ncbi:MULTISPECIES: Imm44 family immunity protein [Pseudomonas]|uniref:Imm44 family immunity protein n=1 Tax=Pseudomonas TaxID=286 RepID=UPI001F002860|nr:MULTISPECIES: Imm44 family immunity protein [Pseudomonas]MCG8295375.1 Imm44 family immunity protein [Pseudomonas entomophila]
MKFWMSSEKNIEVGDSEREARKAVEPIIIELLKDVELNCGAKQWSFISIVMPDDIVGAYPEVKRYHKSTNVVELRVQLPFYVFKESESLKQVSLMLDALARSVEMMGEIKSLKLTEADAHVLKDSVEKARAKLNA